MTTIVRSGLLVALSTIGAVACTTTRAATPVERPALEVPPPPPRVVVPLPPPEAPLPEPVEQLAPQPNSGAPARPRPPNNKPEAPKTEPKTEAPPDQPQPQTQPQPVPPPQLRTPDGGNAQMVNQVRETINRATAILDKIDLNTLSEPRKKAHTDARLFARQADESLKSGNLVFARELADKAERLAKELQGR